MFNSIGVVCLCVCVCVCVCVFHKIDKKQRVNKVKCVVKQIKQNLPQRLGLVCLKVNYSRTKLFLK